jgi:molybdopterin molybdotransferase
LLVARKGRQWVLGLPGNPVSSYVTAFLFLLPLLRALGGASDPLPRALAMPLLEPLPATGERTEFVRARLGPSGLVPLAERDSSALRSLAAADALIERPAEAPAEERGAIVRAYWLENGRMA